MGMAAAKQAGALVHSHTDACSEQSLKEEDRRFPPPGDPLREAVVFLKLTSV